MPQPKITASAAAIQGHGACEALSRARTVTFGSRAATSVELGAEVEGTETAVEEGAGSDAFEGTDDVGDPFGVAPPAVGGAVL